MEKKTEKKKGKIPLVVLPKKPVTRSTRAGLLFPVGRTDRLIREKNFADRVGETAPVYLSAVLQYLISELIEQADLIRVEQERHTLTGEHIQRALLEDPDFSKIQLNTMLTGLKPYEGRSLVIAEKRKQVRAKNALLKEKKKNADTQRQKLLEEFGKSKA